MAIDFACQCGARFRVDDGLAGKRARCQACEEVVTVPANPVRQQAIASAAASLPRPQVFPAAPQPAADAWMDREIERNQALTQSAASNPGRLQISHWKHWMSFPLWPSLWLGLMLLCAISGLIIHWVFFLLAVPLAGLLWLYWWVQRAKFISGCTNPAMVVSVDPPLVAVLTELSMVPSGRQWYYVKVLSQPLHSMTGEAARLGQRLATVATYKQDDSEDHWEDFWPVVVNCVTWNTSDVSRVFATTTNADWRQFEMAIQQVPRPFSPGLYEVKV